MRPSDEVVESLVVAARSGGDWAFGRLWELFSGPVAGYLRRRGVVDVDDVTSEVFLAAFQGLAGFEGDGRQFRSWLFTIAHHRGVDAVRRQVSAAATEYREADDTRQSHGADHLVVERQLDPELVDALDALPEAQREVVVLRLLAELSNDEVAAVTGRTPNTVKQQYRRGLVALRRSLGARPEAVPLTHPDGPTAPVVVPLAPAAPITQTR